MAIMSIKARKPRANPCEITRIKKRPKRHA
jgi:hypothetical protein